MAAAAVSRAFQRLLARPRRARRTLSVAFGAAVAVTVVLAVGELYLRVAPPGDLAPYLPDDERTGPFRDDPKYGVQYRSFEALVADNAAGFATCMPYLSDPNPPPLWAFFGSSFAQAPGMLADTAREFVPQRAMFNLGKNEYLPVRPAQAEFLLDSGMKADRIFLVMIPLDVHNFAQHGLDQYHASPGGAVIFTPRLPSIGGGVIRHSRLALKGWTRTTLHQNRPFFPASALHDRVDPAIRADTRTVLGHLAAAAARHRVPVTLVLLPDYEQVCRGANLAVQEALTEDARALGLDVCDVSEPFRAWPDKRELFIPDKHFSRTGNRLLLAAILEHLKQVDPRAADLPDPAGVRP
jgi:hypothetical protein